MSRLTLATLLAVVLLFGSAAGADTPAPAPATGAKKRPNFVFILADDLGYADIGVYGARSTGGVTITPNLDTLARDGIKFTSGYSNSAVCSPTRFALITGQYQYRFRGGAEEPIAGGFNSTIIGLPPEQPTIPSLLSDAGYNTALIGKWHLGFPPHFGPLLSGYDEFFGIHAGAADYFSHSGDLWADEENIEETGYLTDLLSNRAVDYIDRNAPASVASDEPFFLSLHYTAPHWPWETRDDLQHSIDIDGNIADNQGGSVETYRTMINHLDEGVGWVLDALRKNGIENDTVIIFGSDNGGERFSDNWPHVGGKMDLTEGGIRVPWLVRWPTVIAPGSETDQQAITIDFSATILDAAGVEPDPEHPLDGVSVLEVLKNPNATFERELFWRMKYREQRAVKRGDWKYLKVDDYEYLFNITADSRERANLATVRPELLEELRNTWLEWDSKVPAIPHDAAYTLVSSDADFPPR